MNADLRKLKRAGVEPARVFGRRDFDPKGSAHLFHYRHGDEDWYSPNYPEWMIRSGECGVLDKSIQRYGVEEAPVSGDWPMFADMLFQWNELDVCHLALSDAEDYELNSGVIFPGYTMSDEAVLPATPVMYASRRFGPDVVWTYKAGGPYVRGFVDAACVIVIRVVAPEYAVVWTPPASDAVAA